MSAATECLAHALYNEDKRGKGCWRVEDIKVRNEYRRLASRLLEEYA